MNYLKMFTGFVLMSCVVAVLLSCGEDSPVDSEEGGDDSIEDTSLWRQRIPQLTNYTDNPMNLDLELVASEGDSSYSVELNEDTEAGMKQQMYSNGIYSSQNDSIYLYSNECGALDTTADPDTVAALSDSVCSFVLALPEPENDTITIETASIEPVMYLFPLSAEEVDMIIQVIPELNLVRQTP